MRIFVPLAALLLAACAAAPVPTATYDFGLAPAALPAEDGHAQLALAALTAPPWLDDAGIVYRFSYAEPARRRVYARSRWVGTPAELLSQRLRQRAGALANGAAPLGLHTALEEFEQVFDSATASHAVVQLRAELIDTRSGATVAQRTFLEKRPAGADAAGAVQGLSTAGDAAIDALLQWAGERAGHYAPPP